MSHLLCLWRSTRREFDQLHGRGAVRREIAAAGPICIAGVAIAFGLAVLGDF